MVDLHRNGLAFRGNTSNPKRLPFFSKVEDAMLSETFNKTNLIISGGSMMYCV